MKRDTEISQEVSLIWNTANDVLRDIFKRSEYPDIIYPMVLIRRIEGVLISKTDEIKEKFKRQIENLPTAARKKFLNDKLIDSIKFANTSKYTLQKLVDEGEKSIKNNFTNYLNGYTDNIKKIIERSGISTHINKLQQEKILFPLISDFANIDLNPDKVSNIKMGYIFEELVRKFSEANNEEAGEHYTPREVIDLMVQLLDIDEKKIKDGELVTIYDCACGSGGMLTAAKEFIQEKINPNANVVLSGQEVNDKTWAVCEADLLLKNEQGKIIKGDTLFEDGFIGEQFDFMLSNPPYGKSWKKIQGKVLANSNGRFDVGQPRSSDGQLLFTLHMISKMKPPELGGSAIAVVHNGSPLFSGDASSGESEIRKHILENDWLEAIVALPTNLFYNTGIATYVWIIRNNKPPKRKGKIQLINAVDLWKPMKRSLGDKRRRIHDGWEGNKDNPVYVAENDQIAEIVRIHKEFKEGKYCKIFEIEDFAFRKVFLDLEEVNEDGNPVFEDKEITVAQNKLNETFIIETLEDEQKLIELKNKKGTEGEFIFRLNPKSELVKKYNTLDVEIRVKKTLNGNKLALKSSISIPKIVKDAEYIPWKDDKIEFLQKEVEKKWTITTEEKGYEIPFTKYFYVYEPLRKNQTVINEIYELEFKLDKYIEISSINNIIEAKNLQLEKLEELREIEINNIITRGIDSEVKLRESGIESIGKIPTHWKLNRLKNVCYINQSVLPEKTSADYEIRYVDIGGVTSKGVISEIEEMQFSEAPSRARRKLKRNSILFSTVRTYLKAITIVENPEPNLIASTGFAIIDAHLNSIIPIFLYYQLVSYSFVQRVIANSEGVSYPAISTTKLADLKVIIPPIEEQKTIAQYLKNRISKEDIKYKNNR